MVSDVPPMRQKVRMHLGKGNGVRVWAVGNEGVQLGKVTKKYSVVLNCVHFVTQQLMFLRKPSHLPLIRGLVSFVSKDYLPVAIRIGTPILSFPLGVYTYSLTMALVDNVDKTVNSNVN
jgi:hypothetical protein